MHYQILEKNHYFGYDFDKNTNRGYIFQNASGSDFWHNKKIGSDFWYSSKILRTPALCITFTTYTGLFMGRSYIHLHPYIIGRIRDR